MQLSIGREAFDSTKCAVCNQRLDDELIANKAFLCENEACREIWAVTIKAQGMPASAGRTAFQKRLLELQRIRAQELAG